MRILTLGYAADGFGYGRVLRSLAGQWCRRHEIHHVEMGREAIADFPGVVHRAEAMERSTWASLSAAARQLVPDVVFLFNDALTVSRAARAVRAAAPRLRVVGYCPIDNELEASPHLGGLSLLDELCVYTGFARRAVVAALEGAVLQPPRVSVVPHALDPGRFFALKVSRVESRQAARQALFPERPELWRAFIALNANRNQPRKRIDLTLEAFARFASGRPRAFLYLHMGLRDQGVRILPLARQLGVDGRLLLTSRSLDPPRVSDERLNLIYNACDVGLNTSEGEGWGLVSFEHAATEAAQILGDHTGCRELWMDSGLLARAAAHSEPGLGELHRVDVESVAEHLARLHDDEAALDLWSRRAQARAGAGLAWSDVAQRFEAVFEGSQDAPAASRPLREQRA